MRLIDLGMLYFTVGVAAAVAIYVRAAPRDGRAIASAALAVPLWPLWAPIVLTARRAPPRHLLEAVPDRIGAVLAEALAAVEGSPLAELLSHSHVERILEEVGQAAVRCAELEALLSRPDLDPGAAEQRLAVLEAERAPPRVLASARVHCENVRRLSSLRDRDQRTLEEVSDLVGALRTQLVLARYAGSSVEGVSGIVSELSARVEGLGAAIEFSDVGECVGAQANPSG